MILSKEQFLSLLQEISMMIEVDDSFQGSLQYEFLGNDQFDVEGAVRTGNSYGQGGMAVFPRTPNVSHEHDEQQQQS